ncbi:single-stranded DNA-binding protein [Micropruina sp.]|uniref:single-stranded DNA-binding protein n=1 Tax=Micropruina sp. TaxID=2737536 RepID=UPI0039E277C6
MGIKNGIIMTGHFAGDPRLTYSEKTGTPRFYARVGVDHWRREEDGTFTKTERTFHDLVARYKAAEVAMELFKNGDDFVATGRFRKFPDPATGAEREEFQADTVAPNPVTTRISIDRGPRSGAARETPGVNRSQAFDHPEQSTGRTREPAALGL